MKNNIELYIEGVLMDMSDEVSIALSKTFEGTEDIFEVVEAEYSYEFELPTTYNNKKVFGFTDAFDTPSKFDKLYKGQLYASGFLVLDGNLLINSIEDGYFKVNLYIPAQVSIDELFDGMTLNQIAPHNKYINTLRDVDNINKGVFYGTDDNHICFPYVLYGPVYNTDDELEGKQDVKDNILNVNNIYPSFNVLSVIKDIFKTKNYDIQGNIFSDERFSKLYQTYQADDADKYNKTKDSPYFLGLKGDYRLRRSENTSSTAKREDLFGTWYRGWDTMLLSENTTFSLIDNKYNMLNRGDNGGYVITIPKSGWYKISCKGNLNLPNGDSIIKQDDRVNVGYGCSSIDNTTLDREPVEFIIKKGTPLQNCVFYTMNSSVPCMPTLYVEDNTIKHTTSVVGGWAHASVYLKGEDNSRQNYFGKNNKSTLIKKLGDDDVSDLIVGARWGSTVNVNYNNVYNDDGFRSSDRTLSVSNERVAHIALPRAEMNLDVTEIEGTNYIKLYEVGKVNYGNIYPNITENRTYGYETAQAFALEDGNYFHFDGYNKYDIDTNRWDTSSNFKRKTYYGAEQSKVTSTSDSSGTYYISNVVWLNEGETISLELSIPTTYTYTYKNRVATKSICLRDISITYDFKMGLINSNENWEPTVDSPILSDDKLDDDRMTNVNELLPDISCNEYVNNFLQTFNLKMTKINSTTYSIDNNNNSNTVSNTIDLDPYFNIQEASFSRLDLPTRKVLKWTIDNDEEGYVSGALGLDNSLISVPPEYNGSKVYENPTNTMENEVSYTSQWSYSWYKEVEFVKGTVSKGRYNVPVICTHKTYQKYPSVAYSDGVDPSMTFRLFYINESDMVEFESAGVNYSLIIPKNYYGTGDNIFLLDYNRPTETVIYTNISDVFFRVNLSTQYQIDIPMILPNKVYNEINGSSLAMANGGLYRFLGIDGHDVQEEDESTVSLISLK